MSSVITSATALSEGAQVDGDLTLNHDATVAGEITGDLHCSGTLILAASACIHGDVHAQTLRIAGQVHGDVTVEKDLELSPGVNVGGEITTARLTANDGVVFQGSLRLTGSESPTVANQSQTSPTAKIQRNRASLNPTEATQDFLEIAGTTHAGLRPRRRVPLPSVI